MGWNVPAAAPPVMWLSKAPSAATAALPPASLAELYLSALARDGYDPLAPRVRMPHPFRQATPAWAGLIGRW